MWYLGDPDQKHHFLNNQKPATHKHPSIFRASRLHTPPTPSAPSAIHLTFHRSDPLHLLPLLLLLLEPLLLSPLLGQERLPVQLFVSPPPLLRHPLLMVLSTPGLSQNGERVNADAEHHLDRGRINPGWNCRRLQMLLNQEPDTADLVLDVNVAQRVAFFS